MTIIISFLQNDEQRCGQESSRTWSGRNEETTSIDRIFTQRSSQSTKTKNFVFKVKHNTKPRFLSLQDLDLDIFKVSLDNWESLDSLNKGVSKKLSINKNQELRIQGNKNITFSICLDMFISKQVLRSTILSLTIVSFFFDNWRIGRF